MSGRALGSLLLVVLLGAAACSGDTVTQIVVSVATDMVIPDELDLLQFQAGYNEVNDAVDIEWELDRNKVGFIELPATIALVPGPKLGKRPVLLTTRAMRSGAQVVVRQARLPFANGRILLLKLNLLRRCIGVVCGADESCGELGCEKIDKNPDELLDYSADAAFAGTSDARSERRDSRPDVPIEQLDGGDGPRRDATRDGTQLDTTRDGTPLDSTVDTTGGQDSTVDTTGGQDSTVDTTGGQDSTVDTTGGQDSTVDTGVGQDSTVDTTIPDSTVDTTIPDGTVDVSIDLPFDTTFDVGDFQIDATADIGFDAPFDLPLVNRDGPPPIDTIALTAPPPGSNRIATFTLDGPRRALIERVAPWRPLPLSIAR